MGNSQKKNEIKNAAAKNQLHLVLLCELRDGQPHHRQYYRQTSMTQKHSNYNGEDKDEYLNYANKAIAFEQLFIMMASAGIHIEFGKTTMEIQTPDGPSKYLIDSNSVVFLPDQNILKTIMHLDKLPT